MNLRDEHSVRLLYQGIVYDACNRIDRAFGQRVSTGQGVVIADAPQSIDRLAADNAALRARVAELEAELSQCQHRANKVLRAENDALKAAVLATDPVADRLWPMLRVWGEECQVRKIQLREAETQIQALDAMLNSLLALPSVKAPVGEESVCDVVELAIEHLSGRVEELEARLAAALEALRRLVITYELEWEPPEAGAPFSRPAWLVSVLTNPNNARLTAELRALRDEHHAVHRVLSVVGDFRALRAAYDAVAAARKGAR